MTAPSKTGGHGLAIDYYYSIRGSFAYLGTPRIRSLAARYGRRIVHRPIRLGVTVPAIGGMPFDTRPPLRNAYAQTDFVRWAAFLGMPVHADPVHHVGPLELPSGAVIAAQHAVAAGSAGDVDQLSHLLLQALWQDDRDIADEAVVAELAGRAGFEGSNIVERAVSDVVQLELDRNCREAIVRGVMGSPTYFVDGENFYGQDRLDFVEQGLAAARARAAPVDSPPVDSAPVDSPPALGDSPPGPPAGPVPFERVGKYNTRDAYPEQQLDNDFCQAVVAGSTVYLRGQVSQDLESGEALHAGDAAAQADQIMRNIDTVLRRCGSRREHLTKLVIYLTDPRWRDPVYQAVGKWVKGIHPVCTGLIVSGLARPDYVVEVDAFAEIPLSGVN